MVIQEKGGFITCTRLRPMIWTGRRFKGIENRMVDTFLMYFDVP